MIDYTDTPLWWIVERTIVLSCHFWNLYMFDSYKLHHLKWDFKYFFLILFNCWFSWDIFFYFIVIQQAWWKTTTLSFTYLHSKFPHCLSTSTIPIAMYVDNSFQPIPNALLHWHLSFTMGNMQQRRPSLWWPLCWYWRCVNCTLHATKAPDAVKLPTQSSLKNSNSRGISSCFGIINSGHNTMNAYWWLLFPLGPHHQVPPWFFPCRRRKPSWQSSIPFIRGGCQSPPSVCPSLMPPNCMMVDSSLTSGLNLDDNPS